MELFNCKLKKLFIFQKGTEKAPETKNLSLLTFLSSLQREIPCDYLYSAVKHRELPRDYLYRAVK